MGSIINGLVGADGDFLQRPRFSCNHEANRAGWEWGMKSPGYALPPLVEIFRELVGFFTCLREGMYAIDVLRGLRFGADGYIFKPFEWSTLHDCIKRVLGITE